MKPGELAAAVAAELVALGGWGTTPAAVWFPDLSLPTLKTGGLTALAIVPEMVQTMQRRGGSIIREPSVHVATIKPLADGTFAEGKTVVDKAEAIAADLIGKRLTSGSAFAVCVEIETQPVISAQYAKEYGLWVSYLKLRFRAG